MRQFGRHEQRRDTSTQRYTHSGTQRRPRTHRPFPVVVGLLAGLLSTAVIAATPAKAATTGNGPSSASQTAAASPEATAAAQATATGQPVVVSADTTETDQVTANPDGSFTLTADAAPVRVLQNRAWTPVNTDLVTNPDGTLSPQASPTPMIFSGGGSGPLVTVSSGADSVATSWPAPLPAPTISGSAATYANVFPGVDLVLTATGESYSQTLIVHNPTAAANPALATIKLGLTATGLNLSTTPTGDITGTDATGKTIFDGGRPIMWDSSDSPGVGPAPTTVDPGGAHVSTLAVSMPSANAASAGAATPTTLTLTPPAGALTGPGVVYPLYVDPEIGSVLTMAQVFSNGAPYYNGAAGYFKVGDCAFSGCNGIGVGRSYFNFDTAPLQQTSWGSTAYVADASVTIQAYWSANGCTAEPVNLDTTAPATNEPTNSTVWPGPLGGVIDQVSTAAGGGSGCPSNPVTFDGSYGTSSVAGWVQDAANNDWSTLGFALTAPNEADPTQWKQFYSEQVGYVPYLTATYDWAPSTPTLNGPTNEIACPGKPVYATTNPPALGATSQSVDTQYGLWYQLQDIGTGTYYSNTAEVTALADQEGTWTPSGVLPNGNYQYQAQAQTLGFIPTQSSNWAAMGASGSDFTVDNTPPPTPTILPSFDYPTGYWGQPAGNGSFTISAPGAAGVTYDWNGAGQEPAVTNGLCNYDQPNQGYAPVVNGVATITTPATLAPGSHTLAVKSFTDAHIVSSSDATSGAFYVPKTVQGEGNTRPEAETLANGSPPLVVPSGDYAYQEQGTAWSGGAEEHLVANGASQAFTFTFNVGVSAEYALGVRVTTEPDFGCLQFTLDDNTADPLNIAGSAGCDSDPNSSPIDAGTAFDAYSPTTGYAYLELGGMFLTANTSHTLTATFVGTDYAAQSVTYSGTYGSVYTATFPPGGFADNGFSAGIDYFTMVPINDVTYDKLTDAMNNNGVDRADGQPTTANLDFNGDSLSESALSYAGFGPGATVNVDPGTAYPASFAMPAYNTSTGNDNVVADGQTINLTNQVLANSVDLLVAASCATTKIPLPPNNTPGSPSTPDDPSMQFTLNYTNGNYAPTPLPPVPDWTTGTLADTYEPSGSNLAHVSLVATLNRVYDGTTKIGASVGIYHISIPTTIDAPVESVTLPYLGTTFTAGCTTPALHVLAMTATPPGVGGPNLPGAYQALTPTRILDTRYGTGGITGPIPANSTISLTVGGAGGVPDSGVSAVVFNLTAVSGTANGALTVYPDGTSEPSTSNLNWAANQVVANLVAVAVPDGRVDITNNSNGTVQLIADVQGYYLGGGTPSVPGAYQALTPTRILDTRYGTGGITGPVHANSTISLTVEGAGEIPASGVSAVAVNVTAVGGTQIGALTVYPDGISEPSTTNLNWSANQVVANLVVVPVGADGKVDLANNSNGTVQFIADVQGYYLGGGTPSVPGAYQALTPARILDTRYGTGGITGPLAANSTISLTVEGAGGVPASGVSAVAANITAVGGTQIGALTVYPDGISEPSTSNLNWAANQVVAGLVIVPVGPDGKIDLANNSNGTVQFIADIQGYYLGNT